MSAPVTTLADDASISAGGPVDASRQRYLGVLDVGVLLAAVVIFVAFLFALNRLVFPQGSRLGDIAPDGGSEILGRSERGEVGLGGGAIENFGQFIAELADIRREVKIRSADSVAWRRATEGVTVHNRDAVQTFSDSRARVDFITDNVLKIGQNSLVVFRSGATDPFLQRREPSLVVLDGELAGDINADYGAFAVELPAGVVVVRGDSQTDQAADFNLSVNPDQSSTIAVHSGVADIDVGGRVYRVTAKTGLTIAADGSTTGTRALPGLPDIRKPAASSVARFRETPPRVRFRWEAVDDAQTYRFELARDEQFEEIEVDEYLNTTVFTHGNLAAGEYFWRVSARSGWAKGPATEPRRLRVVRDIKPPALTLEPIHPLAAGGYRLHGRAVGASQVYVRGEKVKVSPRGDFEYLFEARPGARPIVVEAVDSVGNVSYDSQIFNIHSQVREE